ncbi:MAG: mannose-1-phosphate guanylyltransferase [Terriglobales bacterium]
MKPRFYPVILAGGRGTRFWPLSRKRRAKQLLALDGKQTMIQQTMARLRPLAPAARFWVITNDDLRDGIVRQLPRLPAAQIVAEPVGRNTAPAIGLAAFILVRQDPKAVLGLFPSDHVIGDEKAYVRNVQRAVEIAGAGENIVTLGITPTRPETGYGYIEAGAPVEEKERGVAFKAGEDVLRVRRFTEKPDAQRAREFLEAGNYYWNSGMFVWSAQTLVNALREHLPPTAALLEKIAAAWGARAFAATFRRLYPKCENISVDYAVLEPRSQKGERASNLFCIPSEFGWNDLGSWTALYEHRVRGGKDLQDGDNVIEGDKSFALGAEGNYVHAPGKFVAVVGVKDVIVVETPDALLVTSRQHSQDVGKVVKHLDDKKLGKLV